MFYKVVLKISGKLFSIDCPEEMKIEYIPQEFVYPKYGQLFCFNSLEQAKSFSWDYYPYNEIWECEVGQLYKYCFVPHWTTIKEFTGQLWGGKGIEKAYITINKLKKNKKKYSDKCWKLSQFRYGTVLTDKIKLIKRIPKYDPRLF